MINFISADLTNAVTFLATSNSPIEVLKKLRADVLVQNIEKNVLPHEILSALTTQIQFNPGYIIHPHMIALVYVYLVALGNSIFIRRTEHMVYDYPHKGWFNAISKNLIYGTKPLNFDQGVAGSTRSGDCFPDYPVEHEKILRIDYTPSRLYEYYTGQWHILNKNSYVNVNDMIYSPIKKGEDHY